MAALPHAQVDNERDRSTSARPECGMGGQGRKRGQPPSRAATRRVSITRNAQSRWGKDTLFGGRRCSADAAVPVALLSGPPRTLFIFAAWRKGTAAWTTASFRSGGRACLFGFCFSFFLSARFYSRCRRGLMRVTYTRRDALLDTMCTQGRFRDW